MKVLRPQNKPRIKMIDGRWYAIPGHGIPLRQMRLMLAAAIAFCRRLNERKL